ncbi:MAG: hypothetical protein ACT4P7_13175 [Gemmatimonadaceae bacterium]
MTARTHSEGDHVHGPSCGHQAVRHEGHIDYLHKGGLHHPNGAGIVEDHVLAVDASHPDICAPVTTFEGHSSAHQHGPTCGHEMVPHGDHVDYLVDGHLHFPHGKHCDDHGMMVLVEGLPQSPR